jgi:chemotaxis protein MotA
MDLATLLGLIGAFGVIIGAIVTGGDIVLFINPPSLMIVIGGTIAAALIKFPLTTFLGSFKIALKAFLYKSVSPADLIDEAMELANTARKNGLLALESVEITNEFLKRGIQLCVDGHDPEFVRRMLSKDINQTIERHDTGRSIFKAIGDVAPAMGMIGTLIGLVQMLSSMDDPKQIGPAMAIALLTTLYGAVVANAFALPIADKLSFRSAEEHMNKSLILETISGIQEGLNPRVLETLLKTYLPGNRREAATTAEATEAA